MAFKGELWTTQVTMNTRSYYFNVKENRAGDVFLQVVESKKQDTEDRHAIIVFADDMQRFTKAFDEALTFIDNDRREKAKLHMQQNKEDTYRKQDFEQSSIKESKENGLKRTGRVHVVSKLTTDKKDEE